MYKTKKILGTMAIYPEMARSLGRIQDLIVDLDNRSLVAAILPGKTLLHPSVWLDFSHIRGLGSDAVTVEKSATTISTKEIKGFPEYMKSGIRNLWGISVVSHSGELIGYVEDFAFTIPGGALTGIELSRGVLGDVLEGRGFLPADEIVSMSPECIVVERQQVM